MFQIDIMMAGVEYTEAEVDLIKEDEEWKINEDFNPYDLGRNLGLLYFLILFIHSSFSSSFFCLYI